MWTPGNPSVHSDTLSLVLLSHLKYCDTTWFYVSPSFMIVVASSSSLPRGVSSSDREMCSFYMLEAVKEILWPVLSLQPSELDAFLMPPTFCTKFGPTRGLSTTVMYDTERPSNCYQCSSRGNCINTLFLLLLFVFIFQYSLQRFQFS